MVREKDVCWEYCEKLEGNKVKCKFCHRVLNGGISRLKHHLSRLPSKGVHPCAKVRDDVTDRVRAIIALKEEVKEDIIARKHRVSEKYREIPTNKAFASVEMTSPIKLFSSGAPAVSRSTFETENAERNIALFFFENKLDFCVAHTSSYQLMVDAISRCGPGFRGPSPESLRKTWLKRIKSEIAQQSKEIESERGTTGCSILVDTWSDSKSRVVMNFLFSSPSGTFFHRSVDVSNCFKNTKYMSDLFISVIHDFGAENVVQIIVDNTLNYTGISNHIMQNYGMIFFSSCATHCLNLILEDFLKVDWASRCILHAQYLSRFIYNYMWVLDLLKKYMGGQELVRTGVTKALSTFLTLQSMSRHRLRLKHMFSSQEYCSSHYASKAQSISCTEILEDTEFWRCIEELVAVSEPILKVLRDVTGGKPAVGFIYEAMTKAKEAIRTYYIMDESKCKTFLDIVDQRWLNQLHSPLHSAAAYLNPSIQYNQDTKFLGAIKKQFLEVLEKLLPTPEMRLDITGQIVAFQKAQGMFGCNLARESRNTISPGLWWEQYGDSAPGLQPVAVRILSQVCSGFTLERNWITFQQNHTDKRNKLDREAVNDLLYINHNLKLSSRVRGMYSEIDPIVIDDIDMNSDWVVENETANPTQWLDQFGSALDAGDLNTRQYTSAIFGSTNHIFNL